MGMGIWSMHFVGMMSVTMPFPVSYDLIIVLLSVGVAIIASFVALLVVDRRKLSIMQLLGGAVLFASGIVSMHYIGMYAMQAKVTYDITYVLLSVLVALCASVAALWLSLYFLKNSSRNVAWKKIGSALIMGTAIAGMHYTGMMAAHIESQLSVHHQIYSLQMMLNPKKLAYIISIGTLVTLSLSLTGLYLSRLFSKQESEKQEKEKWYLSLYEHNQDGIISVDLHLQIIGINPAAERIFAIREEDYKHQPVSSLLPGIIEEDREPIREMFVRTFQGEELRYETAIMTGQAEHIDISILLAPVIVDNQFAGNYIIARDITEEKQTKERIRYLAFHDELTGLPNRRMFNQSLSSMIEAYRTMQKSFAVMVMDIDRFKMINDSLGHIYGDIFLQEMSGRIIEVLEGEQVVLARMGGDEFAAIFPEHKDAEHTLHLAERIIQATSTPFHLKDNDFYVTGSMGIAVFPEHGEDAVQLLINADTAMYEVKKQGKNGYLLFSQEVHTQLQERMELETDMRKALDRSEFILHYQPQIRTGDVSMIGVEALVRWNHPTRGLLYPGVFIPIAEETGLIIELGNQVLREACRQMYAWHQAGGPLIPVAVNLSSRQFHQPQLVEQISRTLQETGLAAEFLELEITESMMMDATISFDILHQLANLGIRISLDDFGTGYSSLSYLKNLPIHKVKIDRSFIEDIAENSSDKAIVSTIITMAKQLNMDVIAEGIETREQLDILAEQECDEVQGYYYSRPLPAVDIEQRFFVPIREGSLKELSS